MVFLVEHGRQYEQCYSPIIIAAPPVGDGPHRDGASASFVRSVAEHPEGFAKTQK